MTIKIDHVAIAVNSLEDAINLYCEILGLKAEDVKIATREERHIRTAMLPVGESMLQLLESTSPEGAVARHIAERGEGMHHLGLEVNDIQAMLEILKEKGVPLVDTVPRTGHGESKISFLNPKSPNVLIELVEY